MPATRIAGLQPPRAVGLFDPGDPNGIGLARWSDDCRVGTP